MGAGFPRLLHKEPLLGRDSELRCCAGTTKRNPQLNSPAQPGTQSRLRHPQMVPGTGIEPVRPSRDPGF